MHSVPNHNAAALPKARWQTSTTRPPKHVFLVVVIFAGFLYISLRNLSFDKVVSQLEGSEYGDQKNEDISQSSIKGVVRPLGSKWKGWHTVESMFIL